ncbi:MAG TPA: TonB-dependent receptor [Prolixibacteraceae bacterium]|nr:TonB-dependent receptor [Prolixibacteraceae bacterium]
MKKVLLFFVIVLTFSVLHAQEKRVTGRVTDDKSEPLPGVTIVVKGTTTGTITDVNGNFVIAVPAGKNILQLSYIGFDSQDVDVSATSVVQLQLKSSSIGLNEVVAVGYGVQKKVNLSGSIESLKGDAIAKRSTVQTSQALQGMAAGVTVTANNGKPGKEGTSVRIRGIGTINDNNPLVLIDGVASSLDAIDPNDIDNISILKDAASASIYGSRAANGVILITTKRGKEDKVTVTYKGSVGVSVPLEIPKNATAWDYMTLYDEANGNDLRNDAGVPGGSFYGAEKISAWKNATDRDAYPNSDMFRETWSNQASQTQQYLGFSLGNGKIKSNTSVNYTWQDAHVPNSEYSRYGIRSNNSYSMNKYIEFAFDLSVRNTDVKDAAGSTLIEGLMRQPAIYQTRYSNGIWGTSYAGTPHAMQYIFDGLVMRKENWQETIAKISAVITPFSGLRLDLSYAPKLSGAVFKDVNKTTYVYDYKTGLPILGPVGAYQSFAYMGETRERTREDDINILLNYTKSFNKHDVAALGGFQYLTNTFNSLYAYRQGNNFQQFEEINSYDPTGMTNSGYTNEWALMSYFGRLNYGFSGKYLLEANVRYDGSSRFANGYKWGLFPSFSAAWRFSSESFMEKFKWLSNGKLRASWGDLGNQSGLGSNYPFALTIATNQYTVFGGVLNPGYAPVNYALNDITWESTRMIDFGIDLSFFKSKLDLTFDWYNKETRDILLNIAIPGVMGYANSPKQNAGMVENKGWDLTISHNNTIGDFYYKVTGILSDVHNEIIDFGGLAPQVNGVHVRQVGDPIDALYGYVADGLFSSFTEARAHPVAQFGKLQGGDIRYIDQLTVDSDGDGVFDAADNKITGSDRVVLGNPIPRYTYSMDLYGAYKGFDLAVFIQGVGKRDGYVSGWLAYPFANASTVLVQHLDRWSEANPNPDAAYPRLSINQHSNNTQASSFWQVSAAYLRLKNVQLGYSLPANLFKNKGISGVRLYANGTNIFTTSKMPMGMDPESPESVQNSYPLISTYTLGLEVKF